MRLRVEKIELTTNFPIGPVNVYLIFGERLTLVDTGLKTELAWNELNRALHLMGLVMTDIEQVILTHHHNDHAGLLEWIIEKHQVPIYAHKNAQPHLSKDVDHRKWSETFFDGMFNEFGVPPELAWKAVAGKQSQSVASGLRLSGTLEEGDGIPGLSGWEVIETKGHSQDHISLYHPAEQLLICGDHVIKGMHAGIFMDAPLYGEERAKPLIQYMANLDKCLKLPVELALSGHGPDMADLEEAIGLQKGNIEHRARRVLDTLQSGRKTGYEIISEMYPKRMKHSVGIFVFEVISTLDLLQDRQKVTSESSGGIFHYSLAD